MNLLAVLAIALIVQTIKAVEQPARKPRYRSLGFVRLESR